jgi:RNA polymerase sigma factor (sigma-70 family)
MATDTQRAIEAAFRIERPKLIAMLTRMVRDIGTAEELAQDALVQALKDWPLSGIPDRPGAWLTTTGKRLALNLLQRNKRLERKLGEIGREADVSVGPDVDAVLDDEIGDELLGLIFVACHPMLAAEARAALTLRLLGGLSVEEIARAFFVPVPTIQQRIVRAKRAIAKAGVPFEVPRGAELSQRLSSVLEVVYLIFNEGYAATSGDDLIRPQLCEEALRLGRILAGLAPDEPEVHGLLGLMEIQASRFAARVGPQGEPVLLMDQKRARWDQASIRRGLATLERAQMRAADAGTALGPYALQAAIAACHARAKTAEATDWHRIVALYGELAAISASPVVELHRAVALSFAYGPTAGLALVDALRLEPALEGYHLLPAIRADLLTKLGRCEEARPEFERAAALTRNLRERKLLLDRAAASADRGISSR